MSVDSEGSLTVVLGMYVSTTRKSSTYVVNGVLLVLIGAIAVHWFGWLHGIGAFLAVFYLAPFHPSHGNANMLEGLIIAKQRGLL